jgi:alkylhydroperoxidase family enzyme
LEGDSGRPVAPNLFQTLSKHPRLCDRFNRFGGALIYKGILPAREREIVVLRVGWRCQSVYEFGQHTLMGREAGLTDAEIRAITEESRDWSPGEQDLLDLADEMCATSTVSDGLWARLAARWSEEEMIELVLLSGFYRLVSGFLNSVGVEREAGVPGWPA